MSELQTRLLLQSYVAKLAGLDISSSCAYSLCFKTPYRKELIMSIIDKSLYYYFASCVNENESKTKNIFSKRQKTQFSTQELEHLMQEIEAKWK